MEHRNGLQKTRVQSYLMFKPKRTTHTVCSVQGAIYDQDKDFYGSLVSIQFLE